MGIMPPSRLNEAVVDYLEVLRALPPAEWQTFVSLADNPDDFAAVDPADVGEERAVPLSRRQMLWLKVRFRACTSRGRAISSSSPTRSGPIRPPSRENGLPAPPAPGCRAPARWSNAPFVGVGRCNIMGLEAHDHGTVHRDGDPAEQAAPDEFITLYPVPGKQLFVWDEDHRQSHVVSGCRAVWFNDFDYHGVQAAPFFRYSIRVDGVFTDAFRALIAERYQ